MPRRIESLFIDGPAGRLEALLEEPEDSTAREACLVCHPHPLYGGTMHNKVVYRMARGLRRSGSVVLRFNFRGTGTSAGVHDYGRGEIADVRVAIDYMAERFSLPIIFAGFSFGAAIGLRAAVPHPRVEALIALGLPINADGREYTYALLGESEQPKLFVSGSRDEFASPAQLEKIVAEAAEPKRLVMIPEADHFFAGHLDEMRTAISEWAGEVTGRSAV